MSHSQGKISAREEKEWNKLADAMEYYHSHFRHSFESIYDVSTRSEQTVAGKRGGVTPLPPQLADGKFEKQGMSLQMFLSEAASLAQHLDMHHSIVSVERAAGSQG
jgi:hypothetical protein